MYVTPFCLVTLSSPSPLFIFLGGTSKTSNRSGTVSDVDKIRSSVLQGQKKSKRADVRCLQLSVHIHSAQKLLLKIGRKNRREGSMKNVELLITAQCRPFICFAMIDDQTWTIGSSFPTSLGLLAAGPQHLLL
jgi:hypothetical protein